MNEKAIIDRLKEVRNKWGANAGFLTLLYGQDDAVVKTLRSCYSDIHTLIMHAESQSNDSASIIGVVPTHDFGKGMGG